VGPDAILGREEELAAIAHFLHDRARPSVLLLEGEAGIGKTTLWREGVRLAADQGRVLTSRPSEAETRLSFTVLGDLLAEAFEEVQEKLPGGQRRALRAALLLELSQDSSPDPRAVSLGALGVLRAHAARGPVTLAIDDVQWADAPSAHALTFALRRLEDEPIAVIAALRAAPGLADPIRLSTLPGQVERIAVEPLAPAALRPVLEAHLGPGFAPPLVRRIHESSGGNPFFALEIGRALGRGAAHLMPGEPLPVPRDLHELLRLRLADLSDAALNVLLIAALSAAPTSTLAIDAGGDASGLDEAEAGGVIAFDGGAIEFTHPLLASTVNAQAPSRARRATHAALARVAVDPEDRARHLALSVEGPDETVASALQEAALHANARGAPMASADLFQLAARMTPGTAPDQRRERLRAAAPQLIAAGDVRGGRRLLEQLVGDTERGPIRAGHLWLLATASWNDVSRALELQRQALDEAGDDVALRAVILSELAWIALYQGDLTETIELAERAIETEHGPWRTDVHGWWPPGWLTALPARAHAGHLLGHEMLDLLERAIAFEGPGVVIDAGTPRTCLGEYQTWRGELDLARETLHEELDRVLDRGHDEMTWEVRTVLAEAEYRAGNWQSAAQHAREAHEIAVDIGWPDLLGGILPVRAAIACATGEPQTARTYATDALSLCQQHGDRLHEIQARSALGFLELSLGDHASCRAWLAPVVELTSEMGLREPGAFPFLPDAVEAMVALGDLEGAALLTEELEERGRSLGRPLALATSARCRGLIAAARGDEAGASSAFALALEHHAAVAQPFELGRTYLSLGRFQRRMKRRRDAGDSLRSALSIFDELGALLWSDMTSGELLRTGNTAAPPGELTPSERKVAELVIQGFTNREVAGILFISVKTVEASLSRIYDKLGVANRRELKRRADALGGS
jgi:DNA-binding CsgD family transcriptional regulator/tetratricopeptide (TPR) repeat protein